MNGHADLMSKVLEESQVGSAEGRATRARSKHQFADLLHLIGQWEALQV